jgi:hypothetical protein
MDRYYFQLYLPGSQFAQDVNFQTKNCSAAEQVRNYIKNPHIYFKKMREINGKLCLSRSTSKILPADGPAVRSLRE